MADPRLKVTFDPRGPRALDALYSGLNKVDKLQRRVAEAILDKAVSHAGSRPTPQARMVASGMQARRGVVIGFASRRVFGSGRDEPVRMGLLAFGAEFGSDTHRQFGPRNESGYWLHPAAEGHNPPIDDAHEDQVDDAIDDAIRVSKVGL